MIPKKFTNVYENYIALQERQGFDLAACGGLDATRYTYKVTNYPDCTDPVVADLIVCNSRIVAGDVQSTTLGGFMQELAFPKSAPETGADAG